MAPEKESAVSSRISLEPLIEFWEEKALPECAHKTSAFNKIKQRMERIPKLRGEITDPAVLEEHGDIVRFLMSAVFPHASFDTDIAGTLAPCDGRPVFVTPSFERLFLRADKTLKGRT